MSVRPTRSMYYFEGSAVRKLDPDEYYEQPARKPERKVERREVHTERRVSREKVDKATAKKLDKALAFDFKYTVFVVASVFVMVVACVMMLYWEAKVNEQKDHISSLESELETLQTDNAAFKMSLDNMYTLEQVYDAATNELGMVYARKGQIVYYESANEDYVKQYQDVPN